MNIDGKSRVCAVIGNPVEHSLSPALHNAAFAQKKLNMCYVAFHVEDLATAMAGVKGLNLLGLSVTIPHKVAVLDYLDEVEETAGRIGSVNTVLHKDGRLIGYNSDGLGAVRALREALPGRSPLPSGKRSPSRRWCFWGLKSRSAGALRKISRRCYPFRSGGNP